MSVNQIPKETYRQTVGMLGDALGVALWDKASRKGLRDFVCSEDVNNYFVDIVNAYFLQHNPEAPLPSITQVVRAALMYYSPTQAPNESINPKTLAYALEEAGSKKGQRWVAEYHIALFAARLVRHVETSTNLASEEMAWFPGKYHHKISFAVALMYFLFLKLRKVPIHPTVYWTIKQASLEAISYLKHRHRCMRCGQDYTDPVLDPVCTVCPTLEDGEILEFERLREQNLKMDEKLKSEVDDFFDFLGEELATSELPLSMAADVSMLDSDETAWPL